MAEPAAQSKPGVKMSTQGHRYLPLSAFRSNIKPPSYYRRDDLVCSRWVVNLTHSFPPVGVYLLEGECDWQVTMNVLLWFFFISPGSISA